MARRKIRERRFIRSSYERTKGEVERKYVEEIQKIVDKKLNGSRGNSITKTNRKGRNS